MSQCRTSLYGLLESVRLYQLRGDSLVTAELESYLTALERIEEKIARLVSRRFVALCDSEELSQWEKLLEMRVNPQAEEEARRQAVLYRLAVDGNSFTRQGLLDCLASGGMKAQLEEEGELLRIEGREFMESCFILEEITRMVEQFAPAHLELSLSVSVMTWEMFEAKDLTFQDWDRLDFTWEYFDIYGHLLKKEGADDAIQ